MPGPKPVVITLAEDESAALDELTRRRSTAQQVALRARIMLAAGRGCGVTEIARSMDISNEMVQKWRQRWLSLRELPLTELSVEQRLRDLPRCGCPGRITAEQYAEIIAVACEPPEQSGRPITHWSVRELVDEVIHRGIVSSISERQMRRFLQRSRPQTPSDPLLARQSSGRTKRAKDR